MFRRGLATCLACAFIGCGDSSVLEFVELPEGDYILAFILTVNNIGQAISASETITVTDGAITSGPTRFELVPKDGEQIFFVGLRAERVEDLSPMLDLGSLERATLSLEPETCAEGSIHAEDDTLQIPLGPYAELQRLGEGLSFEPIGPAAFPPGLDAVSARLPVQPNGCDPGYPTELIPFGATAADPGPPLVRMTFGAWLDDAHVIVGNARELSLLARGSTTAISLISRPAGLPSFRGISVFRRPDGTASVALQASEELQGGPPSHVIHLEADRDGLRWIGTSTTVPLQITSSSFDSEGGLVASALEGVVLYAPSIDGAWSADPSFAGNTLIIAHATGLDSKPHVVASNNGQVFLGDFSQNLLLEQTTPANKISDLTTVRQGTGLHMWVSSADVSLQPPALFRRRASADWETLTILLPTAGAPCTEQVECGQRRLFKSLSRITIADEGDDRYRIFGTPSTCSAIVSYRSVDLCPTLFTIPGQGIASVTGQAFTFVESWRDRLLVGLVGGGLYELAN